MRIAIYGLGDSCKYLLGQIERYNRIVEAAFGKNMPALRIIVSCFVESHVSRDTYQGIKVVAANGLLPDAFDYLIIATVDTETVKEYLRKYNPLFEAFSDRMIDFADFRIDIAGIKKHIAMMEEERSREIEDSTGDVLTELQGEIAVDGNRLILKRDYFDEDTFYVVLDGRIGDVLIACGFLRSYMGQKKIGSKVCLIIKPAFSVVAKWFSYIDQVINDEKMAESLAHFSIRSQCFEMDNYLYGYFVRSGCNGQIDENYPDLVRWNMLNKTRRILLGRDSCADYEPPEIVLKDNILAHYDLVEHILYS